MLDGAVVTTEKIVVESESEQELGSSFRVVDLQQHPDGVRCIVRIVVQNAERRLVTLGHLVLTARPADDGQVIVKGKVVMPLRPAEYELQTLVSVNNERHLIGRIPLLVTEAN